MMHVAESNREVILKFTLHYLCIRIFACSRPNSYKCHFCR